MTITKMIGIIKDGLRKDLKPTFIAEDAFAELTNAYQFRGRVLRKPGYTLLGRLSNNTPVMGLKTRELFGIGLQQLIAFDTTNAYTFDAGTSSFIALPSVIPTVWSSTNHNFFQTANYAGGFWATNNKAGLHGYALTAFAGAAGGPPWTVNVTAAGNTFALGDTVYFLNVTGAGAANNLIFATVTAPGDPIFSVSTTDKAFTNDGATTGFVLDSSINIAGQDGIRYYGSLSNGTSWANYNPPIDATTALAGARFIFPYRGFLVFLSTWEGNNTGVSNYANRARYTQIGTPYYSAPQPTSPNIQGIDPKTARDDLFGRGGANDAPTNEVIVTAGFIRDVLIVAFERSTWRLRFVNNAQNPFVWERINVELGSSCPQSAIIFDKGLQYISNRGITICDANDAIRFDDKIPDEIFNIRESENGLDRVYGIRTFRTKLSYWTYPDASHGSGIFPDKVLVFNYESQSWAYFDDCFTCFGYFYPAEAQLGYRWIDLPDPWPTYDNLSCEVGQTAAGREQIIAGNQQGFVFILEVTNSENDPSLFISAIVGDVVTSPNNNLPTGSWIKITGVLGTTSADGVSLNDRNFKLVNVTDSANDFTLSEFEPINAGNALGASFGYTINYTPILKGSVRINVGTILFTDPASDGILVSNVAGTVGTINYSSGVVSLTFNPVLGVSTPVYIRIVSVDPEQTIVPVNLTGVYGGEGLIAKISNFRVLTKIFNFLNEDSGTRLSKIDFYTNLTGNGQFICDVLGDSSTVPINKPLKDNPQSNVVLTTKNPYQIGSGEETIYRLFCDATGQTVQLLLSMNDRQMAVDTINTEDFELLSMIMSIRDRGRLV